MIRIVNCLKISVDHKDIKKFEMVKDRFRCGIKHIPIEEVDKVAFELWQKYNDKIARAANDTCNHWYEYGMKVLGAWAKYYDNKGYWVKKMSDDDLWICFNGKISIYSLSQESVYQEVDISAIKCEDIRGMSDLWNKVKAYSYLNRISRAFEPYEFSNILICQYTKIIDSDKEEDDE